MTIRTFPSPAPLHGDARRLEFAEASRLRAAALSARRLYPGCVGELVYRELTAYAEFGYRSAADSLVSRLASEVLEVDGTGAR